MYVQNILASKAQFANYPNDTPVDKLTLFDAYSICTLNAGDF